MFALVASIFAFLVPKYVIDSAEWLLFTLVGQLVMPVRFFILRMTCRRVYIPFQIQTNLFHAKFDVQVIEMNVVPDFILRFATRLALDYRVFNSQSQGSDRVDLYKAKLAYIEDLKQRPIAEQQLAANQQHYEVPTELYDVSILGAVIFAVTSAATSAALCMHTHWVLPDSVQSVGIIQSRSCALVPERSIAAALGQRAATHWQKPKSIRLNRYASVHACRSCLSVRGEVGRRPGCSILDADGEVCHCM